MLSVTTDYVKSTGDPEPYLRRIAETGFTHLHWCHHWDTDFLYSKSEIDQIAAWLDELKLQLLDIHASHGVEKRWVSLREYGALDGAQRLHRRDGVPPEGIRDGDTVCRNDCRSAGRGLASRRFQRQAASVPG